jgi:replication factor C subunit 3/5
MARQLNGPRYSSQILELNASDDRGIDVVRDQIKDFASSKKLFSSGLKLIILDEADQMTKQAQFALRRIIEKYTRNVRFCIICNYVNKIIPALQSRCMRFRFGPLERKHVEVKLREVAVKENVNITDSGLHAIIKLAEGDMRKCFNVLQSCHVAYDVVNEENVYASTGQPLPSDINKILDLLLNSNASDAHKQIQEIQQYRGLSLVDIIERLHELALRITFPPPVLEFLLEKLADIEYRLSLGSSERLQLASLIGTFQIAAHQSTEYKPENDKFIQNAKQGHENVQLKLATSDRDYD